MWDGKPPKIRYCTAVLNYAKGGIKLTDMDSFVKAQKAAWAKRLLDTNQLCSQYLMLHIKAMTTFDLLSCSMDPKEIPHDISNSIDKFCMLGLIINAFLVIS